jgi:hypothetical protein
MELDNLKTIWKQADVAGANTSAEELEQMLSKKSKSPIAKLRHNLFREMLFVVILYSVTIIYYFAKHKGIMLANAWLLIVLGLLYMIFYFSKRRLLKKMECITCEVKSNLSMQLTTLEKFVRLYLIVGTLLMPVILITSGIIGYFYFPTPENLPASKEEFFPYYMAGIVILSLVFTIPVYFLNKWYVNLLYGRHVKKLREIVNEMNELPFQ